VVAAAGLYWDFQRPPLYRSSASILTVALPDVDQRSQEADPQHVAIQRQLLLGQPLLEAALQRLAGDDSGSGLSLPSIDRLQGMLSVVPVPETNLLQLRAEGSDPKRLSRLVNSLIDSYLELRERKIREATGETTAALRQQYEEIGDKITRKREELDRFRRDNDILSIGRDENQAVARLKGLNQSLNDASEEEVKAQARLDAIKAAAARGDAVVPDQDKRALAQLQKRAQELREQLAELDHRYTRDFLALEPSLKVIPEQLAAIEKKIGQQLTYGRNIVLSDAKQDSAAARQAVRELRRQIQEHKSKASEFTRRFAEHEALQEDLARLEELYRTTEERLVQIEVEKREKFPQVEVVERAFPPERPISPPYLRDAGIVLAVALLIALFVVWLVEYLSPKRPLERSGLTEVRIFPEGRGPVLEQGVVRQRLNGGAPAGVPASALQAPQPRELTRDEVKALFQAADVAGRQLIALLLSGVTLDELIRIEGGDIDPEQGRVTISGRDERVLEIPAGLPNAFRVEEGIPAWRKEGEEPETQELDAHLYLAAVDAGLQGPEQIDTRALRYTYIAYLVCQGIRLSELGQVVGRIPTRELAAYGALSPPGAGRSIGEIDLDYPIGLFGS
jgi:uncharacterized protein involved in exopolysaccharide biosynthesis